MVWSGDLDTISKCHRKKSHAIMLRRNVTIACVLYIAITTKAHKLDNATLTSR
jgi:hypothetical protein